MGCSDPTMGHRLITQTQVAPRPIAQFRAALRQITPTTVAHPPTSRTLAAPPQITPTTVGHLQIVPIPAALPQINRTPVDRLPTIPTTEVLPRTDLTLAALPQINLIPEVLLPTIPTSVAQRTTVAEGATSHTGMAPARARSLAQAEPWDLLAARPIRRLETPRHLFRETPEK